MQYPVDWWQLKLLYDWQTLFAGLLALLGALITVYFIQKQIRQTSDLANDVRTHEEFAAKAVLPLALSQLSRYGQDCIELLNPLTEEPRSVVSEAAQTPRLPENVISVLQESARYAEPAVASQIAALLSKIQIQQARLISLLARNSGKQLTEYEGVSAMIDAADVYARTAELYDYARDIENTRRRAEPEKLRRALHNCNIWEDDHPAMAYIIRLENKNEGIKVE